MEFGVLGPLLGDEAGVSIVPTAPKQRQLLALLLMNANRPVTAEYCIEELWGSRPPASATTTLQTYVMQLRRLLGTAPSGSTPQRLQTHGRLYTLSLEPGEFDVDRFEEKVRVARQTLATVESPTGDDEEDRTASKQLREALAIWRSPVFADTPTGPVLRMWATSLRETRLAILEQRIEVDLRLGRHRELIGELSGLVQRSPLTESLVAHLMLALYRSGRQHHALQAYARLRQRLATDLGLTPTPSVQHLHRQLLRNDPELDPPAAKATSRFSDDLGTGRIRPRTTAAPRAASAPAEDRSSA